MITLGDLTQASFGGLASGSTYFFVISAYDANALESDFSPEIIFTPTASQPPPLLGNSFTAGAGILSSPFVSSTNGAIFQTVSTTGSEGGRALYSFYLDEPGYYTISALVNAASSNGNSFCVDVDAEPIDPQMVWNVPPTSDFESNVVTWEGSTQPKVFVLSAGAHQLIIRGRSAFTQLGAITIDFFQTLSAPWLTDDIGSNVLPTDAAYSNGVYTVLGAGALTGTSDSFRFVYRSLTGDGEIRSRIALADSQSPDGCAGIMLRENLSPDSPYAFLGLDQRGSFRWQKRLRIGGPTVVANIGKKKAFGWARIARKGNVFKTFVSINGKNWVYLGARSIPMSTRIYAGFAVASGSTDAITAADFDDATVVP